MANILITGGTGLIGKALTEFLIAKKDQVIVLTRNPSKHAVRDNLRYAGWDIRKQSIDEWAIREADHIIHLAGAGVAEKRWTAKRKKEIYNSRVLSGKLICKVLQDIPNKVESVISASAIGWYGADLTVPNERPFMESDPAAEDFLGETCREWEQSILPVESMGKRLVILRTGIVLSPDGGALEEFRKPLRFGLATILSDGRQVISWIHLNDMVRLYATVLKSPEYAGVYNAVAPNPVNNKTLVLELARTQRGKAYIPLHVPGFLLEMVLGEMSIEVLKSCTVSSGKLSKKGFQFAYSEIGPALASLLK